MEIHKKHKFMQYCEYTKLEHRGGDHAQRQNFGRGRRLENEKFSPHLFKKDGYDVTEAVSGEEALQLLTEQAFHLILLDIMVNKAGLAYNPIQTIRGVGYRFYRVEITIAGLWGFGPRACHYEKTN
ncbi:hypothetical protein AZ66_09610 [Paenibacillus sp. E194]|nr:hypothetical protein AZ66_09610 [Paenibacillus sp. E194]